MFWIRVYFKGELWERFYSDLFCAEYYPNCEVMFMGMANIHSIRRSFQCLRALCAQVPDPAKWVCCLHFPTALKQKPQELEYTRVNACKQIVWMLFDFIIIVLFFFFHICKKSTTEYIYSHRSQCLKFKRDWIIIIWSNTNSTFPV